MASSSLAKACVFRGYTQGQQQNSEDLHLDGSAATDAPFLMLPSGPSSTDVLQFAIDLRIINRFLT